ncbi:MAG TPA: pyridoxamine 5'-phosphate oxidase family protein [Jatrophihabitantaceae bacterium]
MNPPARSLDQRLHDTLHRLEHDVDAWVATSSDTDPYLVPLSFLWDGTTFLLATPTNSPTGRNLRKNGKVRLGIGLVRDVVLAEGTVTATPATEIPDDVGDAFAVKTGFDPRTLTTLYHYFWVRPRRIQAWREADELDGRELMRESRWLASPSPTPEPPA